MWRLSPFIIECTKSRERISEQLLVNARVALIRFLRAEDQGGIKGFLTEKKKISEALQQLKRELKPQSWVLKLKKIAYQNPP